MWHGVVTAAVHDMYEMLEKERQNYFIFTHDMLVHVYERQKALVEVLNIQLYCRMNCHSFDVVHSR